MCPSSEGAADVMAKNAKELLDDLKGDFQKLETLHLWPDDLFAGGWCSCPECKGLSPSDQSLLVLNKLAERLALGETMLGHCAYHASVTPPEKITAHENVRLMFAPRERSYRYPLDGCESNRWYLKQLKGLINKVPRQPEVFEYYHDLMLFRFLPMPLHKIIGRDTEVYQQAGITGIGSLSFQNYSFLAYGPNAYILGRCLWRGKGSREDIRNYCNDIYGPKAGPLMVEYFDQLFELCATAMDTSGYKGFADLRIPPPYQAGVHQHAERLAPLVTTDHLDAIETTIQQALLCDEPYRTRVQKQYMLWKFARQEVQTIYLTIKSVPMIPEALSPDASAEKKAAAARRIRRILHNIESGTAMLVTMNDGLTGPFVEKGNSSFEERNSTYQRKLRIWLRRLENSQK
jgi:hypothetical protein